MSLIEGIGDEVTHFFIALLAVIIVYIAWWSTNISEQRQYRTVLLLDRRRRPTRSIVRVRIPRRLSNHTETVTISEGTSTNTNPIPHEGSSETSELTSSTPQAAQAQPKPNIEQTQSNIEEDNSSDSSGSLEPRIENRLNNIEEVEERDIIETMDADTQNILRLRRLAHFEGSSGSVSGSNLEEHLPETSRTIDSASNTEFTQSEEVKAKFSNDTEVVQGVQKSSIGDVASITIKLKFINDDIRIVDGRLDELLGDFKKRHFEQETNTNKIVRLIFNGQVLKQDRFTLQSCGLFDNCVVHCLIHQKRPSAIENQSQETANASNADLFRDNPFVGVTNLNNNNQGIDWDLGNFLFALVSFILLAAWYFRYVYAHLYTVTATVGLIIITGVFSIVLVGTYFPDTEIPDSNTRIRIARAERIEAQQQ